MSLPEQSTTAAPATTTTAPLKCDQFPFRLSVDHHPGQCNSRKSLLLHNREQLSHKDLPSYYYKPIFLIFFPIMLMGAVNTLCIVGLLIALFLSFISWPVWASLAAIVAYRSYSAVQTKYQLLSKRAEGLDHIWHQKGSIKQHPNYQNLDLIKQAYALSPYRLNLYHHAYHIGALTSQEYDDFYHEFMDLNKEAKELYSNVQQQQQQQQQQNKIDNTNPAHSALQSKLTTMTFRSDLDMVNTSTHALDNLIYHQAIEGYCFFGTIGTIILSLPANVKLFSTPRVPQPVRLDQVSTLLHNNCEFDLTETIVDARPSAMGIATNKARAAATEACAIVKNAEKKTKDSTTQQEQDVTPTPSKPMKQYSKNDNNKYLTRLSLYHVDNDIVTLDKFTQILLQANNVNTRIAVNFLRTPLFNPDAKTASQRAYGMIAGHWSCVASCLLVGEEFYALVLDVNHTFGSWLVPVKDLFYSCYTRDENDFRGLAVFEIKDDLVEMYHHHCKKD